MAKDEKVEKLSNSEINVDVNELIGILDSLSDKKRSVSEATGSLRNALKQVLDDKGWHAKALSTIRTINDMSDSYRADFLRSFVPMFEAMMQASWADEMDDLLGDGEQTGNEGGAEE